MKPVITTIIPVYNKSSYLNRCLESVVGQSLRDIEIILINDGSTDNSLEICREWEKRDSRIRVFDKENGGPGAARNKGISESCGQYISFIDADDYISPDTYKICVDVLEENKADACYFGRNLVDSNGRLLEHSMKLDKQQIYQDDEIRGVFINFFLGNLPENEYKRHFITGNSCCTVYSGELIRRNNVRYAGKEIRYNEDSLFNIEICRYAKKIVAIPNMLYYYCIYQDSTSREYAEKRFEAFKLLHDKMQEAIPYCNDKEDAAMRIDFRFALNLCKCVRDEAHYVKKNGIRKAYHNIKKICNDDKTQSIIPKVIRNGYVSKRNMLLRLVIRKRAAFILGYYLLKEKQM